MEMRVADWCSRSIKQVEHDPSRTFLMISTYDNPALLSRVSHAVPVISLSGHMFCATFDTRQPQMTHPRMTTMQLHTDCHYGAHYSCTKQRKQDHNACLCFARVVQASRIAPTAATSCVCLHERSVCSLLFTLAETKSHAATAL